MKSSEVRKTFIDFFKSKQHEIVASAPMVIKNDPTLMFTNAGMNQFKDIFLGNSPVKYPRIADTQKCLRVSGKHNDLEEVGHDTYHHTMFEMLGNWSFGDYFKKEAIEWAWELLTKVYKIDETNLYITVFGGDDSDGLSVDNEAYDFWKKFVPEERILFGSKKDNFWEMGDTGPCGPCSEIHIDLRDDKEKFVLKGRELVNKSDPLVIEIWNLVFIEFNRQQNGELVPLPSKHVDTGMGFERLSMVMQNVKSNYDTDVFQPIISEIAKLSGTKYGENEKADIAMRVIADHLRAVSFAIADGQLPSNNKAGYVIRRILRRAVRYGYTFLDFTEPFINKLVPVLASQMGTTFNELNSQKELIIKVINEEEQSFLRTLANGITKFENYIKQNPDKKILDGAFAFELFDTFGFPIDLTQLMAKEISFDVDMEGFANCMDEQKSRSRQAAVVDKEDWVIIKDVKEIEFVGYDVLSISSEIVKYRKIKAKDKEFYQVVLAVTPFYAESGGQAGDKGYLESEGKKYFVDNTVKENDLIIHLLKNVPENLNSEVIAVVDEKKRISTANNHTATHLLHSALRNVLGDHVEQKGSLVDDEKLRFDFAHFSKLTDEEIAKVEELVNTKIREDFKLEEFRNIPIAEARDMGATALFGEKYGDNVRVISFGGNYSMELCGGTHVQATGEIGLFKIVSESAIAAGVRRIEAVTANKAELFVNDYIRIVEELRNLLKGSKDVIKNVESLIDQNNILNRQIAEFQKEKASSIKTDLLKDITKKNDINVLIGRADLDAQSLKNLAFELKIEIDNLFLVLFSGFEGKPSITVMLSENLVKDKNLNAVNIVRELAKEINGGGGGQDFYATAGGKNIDGIESAIEKAKNLF
jgi:alanyl-tRNA synthetase